VDLSGSGERRPAFDDSAYPGFALGAAAHAIGVTPAFLRATEAAGLFQAFRSIGGHRRYSRADLQRVDRARQLVDDGIGVDAAVRIIELEHQLATANAMIELLRRRLDQRTSPDTQRASPDT